jgi:hypothetical protein
MICPRTRIEGSSDGDTALPRGGTGGT